MLKLDKISIGVGTGGLGGGLAPPQTHFFGKFIHISKTFFFACKGI